jgi:hypothetical protein
MAKEAPDWPVVSSGPLETAIGPYQFIAGIAPGKLSPSEADTMRRLRDGMDADLRRLRDTLSTIAPEAAAEIEKCVARLLDTAGRIWQLSPIPTPNSRKTVQDRNPAHIRKRKAAKAEPINQICVQICKDVFAKMADDSGEVPRGSTKPAADQINQELQANKELQALDSGKRLSDATVHRYLKKFREGRL